MPNASTEFGADGARIAIVPVGGHLVPRHDRHRFADRKNASAAVMSRCSMNITSSKASKRSGAQ